MNELGVTEAVISRRAVRDFTDQPVPEALLRDVLTTASQAPSGSNIQPWKVYAFAGDALVQALGVLEKRLFAGIPETPEFPTYPEPLDDPYRARRSDCGERMYAALDIPRGDKTARVKQVMQNYRFFGAPVGMIITMDPAMGEAQTLDIGIFAQTIALVARAHGLDTCLQVSWTLMPKAVRDAFGIPGDERVMLGISLGYGTPNHPVNHLNQPRADLDEFVSFQGFRGIDQLETGL
tara:strand:+ start:120922 stop:121629 length:708 start_codon:yes stop_codon:yes gene_type:complete